MRGLQLALLAGAALFIGTSAEAATTIVTFGDGTGGLSSGETLYANFNSGVPSYGGVTGSNYQVMSGNVSGQGADPAVGDQGDPYLSVGYNGQTGIATFDFTSQPGGGVSQIGLDYGSADAYNSFIIHLSDNTFETFTGQQVIDFGLADGNQQASNTNGRLTFKAGSGLTITGIDLTSTQAALEADNLGVIAAVPEPSTWGLMLFGFGAMGVSLRRRRRRGLPILAQAV